MFNEMGRFMAKLKIAEVRQSLVTTLDNDAQMAPEQQKWIAQRAKQLLYSLGNSIELLGERMKRKQVMPRVG